MVSLHSIKLSALYTCIVIICIVCAIVALPWMAYCFATGRERGWLIAKAFDRVGNALSGGSDTEYLSDRSNQARRAGKTWGCILCRLLDIAQKGHCQLYNPPGITD
jgi:hypothetical protein